MNFATNKASERAFGKAAAAVVPYGSRQGGFTLLELMVVIAVIGILATLAYSNLVDLISTNRAKETAQTMRSFAERALIEGKRLNESVTIQVDNNVIKYTVSSGGKSSTVQEELHSNFLGNRSNITAPTCENVPKESLVSFNAGAVSQVRIGISGIALKTDETQSQGYFVACDARAYCGAAVKVDGKNSFVACIKKGASASWGAL